jgi:adenine-specific DNA-methyltransferase
MMKACSDLTPEQRLARIGRNLKGIELDEFSGWMSEVFLRKALQHDFEASGLTHSAFVEIRDSLTVDPKDLEAYDLVVGNPPYGKIKLDPEIRQIWTRGLYGHANLYGLFTDLAVRLTAPGGIIAYVTPASFLGGQYFRALRELLMNEAPPTTFDFVTQREGVFAGVLQETVLSVFKKDLNPKTVSVSYLKVSGLEKLSVTSNGSYPLLKGGVPWVLPRNKEQSDMMKHYARMSFRLSDYGYKVSTGPLVWNRNKARLSEVKIQGTVPVIWAESIPPGEKGLFSYKVSGRNHVPWYSPSSKMDPNLIRESCVLLQRTTSLEQERRLIAAVLPESFLKHHGGLVTVENHVNMIRPLPGRHPLVGPEVIATLLNSRVLDDIFRCINGSTAVSAYELESLPLPDPDSLKQLEKAIENEEPEDIENLVKDLYTNERSKAAA